MPPPEGVDALLGSCPRDSSNRDPLWAGYESGEGIDADIAAQFGLLEEALEAMGVLVWPMVALEADDAPATAAASHLRVLCGPGPRGSGPICRGPRRLIQRPLSTAPVSQPSPSWRARNYLATAPQTLWKDADRPHPPG
jgi:hypothetical protein